jgi:sulfite exporter TauE/SafE
MVIDSFSYLTAFSLGLLGSIHCIGMCGGISGALALAIGKNNPGASRTWPLLLSFNLGRIISYMLIGLGLGALTTWLSQGLWATTATLILRLLAGLLLIAMGLYLANWWRGLKHLERWGGRLWHWLTPPSSRQLSITSLRKGISVGFIWGWLPCGLVYSTLIWAVSQQNPGQTTALMGFFGLGTLPAVLASGIVAERLTAILRLTQVRLAAALLVILFGLWTLTSPVYMAMAGHQHGEMQGTTEHNQAHHHHH